MTSGMPRGGSVLVPWVLLVTAALPSPAGAQRRDTGFAADWTALMALAPGDKVRVWIKREARVTGVLTEYHPPDSLSVERSLDFFHLSPPRQYDVYWIDVRRIDVPHGRDLLGGAARGVGAAVGVGLSISFLCTALGGDQCGVLRWSLRAAPATVPMGVAWGFFSTRWRRVY
jgi:hypothetical protein